MKYDIMYLVSCIVHPSIIQVPTKDHTFTLNKSPYRPVAQRLFLLVAFFLDDKERHAFPENLSTETICRHLIPRKLHRNSN